MKTRRIRLVARDRHARLPPKAALLRFAYALLLVPTLIGIAWALRRPRPPVPARPPRRQPADSRAIEKIARRKQRVLLFVLEELARQTRLPDDRLERPNANFVVQRHWDRDGGSFGAPLHHGVTAALPDLLKSVLRQ